MGETKQAAETVDDKAAVEAEEKRVADQKAAAAQCASTHHAWALPASNPFNSAALKCDFSCKRCVTPASFEIVVAQ